jgi:hypothetical protein
MIRHAVFSKLAMAAIVTLALTAQSHAAGNPDGNWKWSFTTANGQAFDFSLALKHEGDKLTGQLMLPMGQGIDIKDGTFKNDEVNFAVEFERNGNTMKVKYSGKLDGDTIKGKSERERDGQVMARDWEAKREKK